MAKQIKLEDIKVGLILLAYDEDDCRWWKSRVEKVENEHVYLKDVDDKSFWQGLEWDVDIEEVQDISLYRAYDMMERDKLVEELQALNKKRTEIHNQLDAIDHEKNLSAVKQFLGKCYMEAYNGDCIRCLFVYDIDEKRCEPQSLLVTYYSTESQWFEIECYTLFNPNRYDEDGSKWNEIPKSEFDQHYQEVLKRITNAHDQ